MFLELSLLSGVLAAGSKMYDLLMPSAAFRVRTGAVKAGAVRSEAAGAQVPHELIRQNDLTREEIDRQLVLALFSTTLTGAGALVYAPLIPLGLTGVLYAYTFIVRKAWRSLADDGKVTVEALETVLIPGLLLKGYYFATCFSFLVYTVSLKLLSRIEDHSRKKVLNLFDRQPRTVWIVKETCEVEIPFESLRAGDVVVVTAGEAVPADGVITGGTAAIDQHLLTGEAMPAEKGAGDPVFASTVVLSGRIRFRVEKSHQETVVAQITAILNRTVDYKTGVQSLGEKIADQCLVPTMALSVAAVPVAGSVSALAVLGSYIGGDVRVMIPLSTLNFLKVAADHGILIKDGRALELLSGIDTVVFDKTGTLTTDRLDVCRIHPCDGHSAEELLRCAALAEQRQSHPIARAIIEKAAEYGIAVEQGGEAAYEAGYGLKLRLDDAVVRVGSVRFMVKEAVEIPEEIAALAHREFESGNAVVMVARDQRLMGMLVLHPTVRPEVRHLIRHLKKRRKRLYMLTGDHRTAAEALARELGIDQVVAEVFPEQKAELIEQLQREGRSVCFVGDGINDSIAMKKAHVSVSLCGASTVATDTANIVLMDGSLAHLETLFVLAGDFDTNVTTSLMLTMVPGILNIGSVFLLHTGIYVAMGLYLVCLPVALCNAFLPTLRYRALKQEGLINRAFYEKTTDTAC